MTKDTTDCFARLLQNVLKQTWYPRTAQNDAARSAIDNGRFGEGALFQSEEGHAFRILRFCFQFTSELRC